MSKLPFWQGLMTLCEALHLVAGLCAFRPTRAVGQGMYEDDQLRKKLTAVASSLPDEAYPEMMRHIGTDLHAAARCAFWMPVRSEGFEQFSEELYRTWDRRSTEEQMLNVALHLLLEEMRRDKIGWAWRSSRMNGSPMHSGRVSLLMQRLSLDLDLRHLVPSETRKLCADHRQVRHDWILYDVTIEARSFSDQRPRLGKVFQANSKQTRGSKLNCDHVLKAWFQDLIASFEASGASPTEQQLIFALKLDFPDNSGHRDAGRKLIAELAPRPRGRPRAKMP